MVVTGECSHILGVWCHHTLGQLVYNYVSQLLLMMLFGVIFRLYFKSYVRHLWNSWYKIHSFFRCLHLILVCAGFSTRWCWITPFESNTMQCNGSTHVYTALERHLERGWVDESSVEPVRCECLFVCVFCVYVSAACVCLLWSWVDGCCTVVVDMSFSKLT